MYIFSGYYLGSQLLGLQHTPGIYKSKCDIMVMCWVRIKLGQTSSNLFSDMEDH